MSSPLARWQELAEVLREEFQEQGGMLQLLGLQQQAILARDIEGIEEQNRAVHAQLLETNRLRLRREKLSEELARASGLPPMTPLRELVGEMPGPTQGLFDALLSGAEETVAKVRKKIGQNRLLLARASELDQSVLHRLQPEGRTPTYARNGSLSYRGNAKGLGGIRFTA